MLDYNARKEQKIERYQELAEKNKALSNSTLEQAHKMADVIPLGQPILIGHHSEGSHRRYLAKIDNKMRKGIELDKKADYYEHKAETAESNHTISSDDPEAVTKLKEKIASAEANQTKMKSFNKFLRTSDNAGMLALGFSQTFIDESLKPGRFGGPGFATFQLTNNNANIRRMTERLAQLEKHSADTTTERIVGDIKIVDNVELNRLQIFFPGKPDEATRSKLKSSGFRWSPTEGAWQRQRSNSAIYAIKQILEIK